MEISDTPFFKSPAPILPTPPFLWEEKSKLSFFRKFQNSVPPSLMGGSCSKMNFSKKSPFLKNSSTFKA